MCPLGERDRKGCGEAGAVHPTPGDDFLAFQPQLVLCQVEHNQHLGAGLLRRTQNSDARGVLYCHLPVSPPYCAALIGSLSQGWGVTTSGAMDSCDSIFEMHTVRSITKATTMLEHIHQNVPCDHGIVTCGSLRNTLTKMSQGCEGCQQGFETSAPALL